MGKSGRSYAPVAAPREAGSTALPEWLFTTDDAEAESVPAVVAHDHVVPVRQRPTPRSAAELVALSTPQVERMAPAARRFAAPRGVWARRGLVAGALVGSCAVLVSGIVLTQGVAPSDAPAQTVAAASTTTAADLREQLWGSGLAQAAAGAPSLVQGPITSAPFAGAAEPGVRPTTRAIGSPVPNPSSPSSQAAPSAPSASASPSPSPSTQAPATSEPPATTQPPASTQPPSSDPPSSQPPSSDPSGDPPSSDPSSDPPSGDPSGDPPSSGSPVGEILENLGSG